ncbi:MAG TPA: N-acetylmuramoyl-L-alanine amidase, partial [Gemmatimonadales bacterium]|nr:N-acetylmuramoyl-L-alanine amidase [Gemmatimonadales bacterium]
AFLLAALAVAAPLAAQARPAARSHLPPIPRKTGPLAIQVVYPAPTDLVDAGDSSQVFGQVGDGRAKLTINGQPVAVARNGAFLAYLRLPPDTAFTLELVATRGADTARLSYPVRRVPRYVPPDAGAWLDTTSLVPRGRAWWPAGEPLPVTLRAAPGATVQLRLPDGRVIPFANDPRLLDVPWGTRAFDRDTAKLRRPVTADRYAALLTAPLGDDPGPLLAAPVSRAPLRVTGQSPTLEVILGADTLRWRWPVQVGALDGPPRMVRLDDDTAGAGGTDSTTVGRTLPGGTYYYFFPTGTRAEVTGRVNGELRLRLSQGAVAWVSAADAVPLPLGVAPRAARVGSVRLTTTRDGALFRIPVSERVPFKVLEEERRLTLVLYGAQGDVNWIQRGPLEPLVEDVRWAQPAADEVTLTLDLSRPVWGYRTRWDGDDLLFEVRRPPRLSAAHPLAGRLIVVDPGHPPIGATGPTGLREPEANLAVALRLERLLKGAGARVLLTRRDSLPVDLFPRVRYADSVNADLLVSIHNNALPDGVDPFANNGTSVYYNQPRSYPWAQAVETALVRRLGLTELGVGRGDLAMVRPTWMPSILAEGMFMSLPRTVEGSGIGLALVEELAQLHGGGVTASSTPGAGSVFEVRVPLGRAHLAAERIVEDEDPAPAARGAAAAAFVDEALGWIDAL